MTYSTDVQDKHFQDKHEGKGNNLCPKMQFIEYLKKKKDYFETIPLPKA